MFGDIQPYRFAQRMHSRHVSHHSQIRQILSVQEGFQVAHSLLV